MTTRRIFAFLLALTLAFALAPRALADLPPMPDPVHVPLDKQEPPPMESMRQLAQEGDTRAMFIVGDMYEKQKNGLPKNWTKARKWFEDAGMHGMNYAFIRLAAMAKHDRHPKKAWQWYTLAIDGFSAESGKDASATLGYVIQARQNLVKKDKLSDQDISAARAAMNAWENLRDKTLDAENDASAAAPPSVQPDNQFKLNQ